jgi:hypothetical protein
MNLDKAVQQLENQGKTILALGRDLSIEQARWKPKPEEWSLLETLNHLVDEEQYDFRRHLHHILFTPNEPWPKIAPQDWVIAKKYNLLGLDQTLNNFKSERKKSLEWLKSLSDPDLSRSIELAWGNLSAGDMLASWLAHDLLHLRQLVELRYQLTKLESEPFNVDYAGKW